MPLPAFLRKGAPFREWVKRRVADSAVVLGTLTHVETDVPAVALTFDDGPHPVHTPRLLDVLAAAGARATFFVVGRSARRWPEVVARAAAEGHAVANHSWDHTSFPLLKGRWRRLQLRWCQRQLPPGAPRLFRPPWGHMDLGTRLDARRLGFLPVAWDIMAWDWGDDPAETLADRVAAALHPGAIVLLHDALYEAADPAHRDRTATVEAVRLLLDRLAGRYRFVTVPDLLTLGRPRYWHWYQPADLDWLERQV